MWTSRNPFVTVNRTVRRKDNAASVPIYRLFKKDAILWRMSSDIDDTISLDCSDGKLKL